MASPLRARDLPVVLYLNQRLTFDLLASLENGFSHFTTVQSSSTDEQGGSLGGRLGISNIFALVGIGLDAKASTRSASKKADSATEELVHTPASLFARLRQSLIEENLVRELGSFDDIEPGEFIEFQAALKRSPLVTVLHQFSGLIPFLEAIGADNVPGATSAPPSSRNRNRARGGQGQPKRQSSELDVAKRNIDAILQALSASGSEDLIAEAGELKLILTAEAGYFVDPTMNDVIDGTFRVFGKVTRVIRDGSDQSISLLRKTSLGPLASMLSPMVDAIEATESAGFKVGKVETEINAPTLQIVPIAIFA
jgi:hypothetical protein